MTPTHLVRAALVAGTVLLSGCAAAPGEEPDAGEPTAAESVTSSPDASPTTASVSELPDDFPLAHAMAAEEDLAGLVSDDGRGLRDLEICGERPLAALEPTDRLVADNSGGESVDTRELLLLRSSDEAARAAEELAALARSCPTEEQAGTVTTTEVHPSLWAPEPDVALVRTYEIDGRPSPGAMVHHVVARGNALLVTATYGEWPDAGTAIEETWEPVTAPVATMTLFTLPPA